MDLDIVVRSENDMHIVEQAVQGLQRLVLDPWPLALDRWRRALDALPPARTLGGRRWTPCGRRWTLGGWCQASWRSRSTPWLPRKALRLRRKAPRGSGGTFFDRRWTESSSRAGVGPWAALWGCLWLRSRNSGFPGSVV